MSIARVTDGRGAAAMVLSWCGWYTRGLPAQIAEERRDEIASDLFEHSAWAAENGLAESAIVRGIRWRALSGVPADLSWRRQQLRLHESAEQRTLRLSSRGNLPLMAYTLSLLVLVASGLVALRVLLSLNSAQGTVHEQALVATLLAVAASVCALGLMARQRTRWMGALWMIVALYCLVRYGTRALLYASASQAQLNYSTQAWDAFGKVLVIGLALFFVGMAIRWFPSQSRDAQQQSQQNRQKSGAQASQSMPAREVGR